MRKQTDKAIKTSGTSSSSATERVLAATREAIIALELPPGSMIDKAVLCERFGVSRFPVSDALSRLQAEGLVEILPQRGTRVIGLRMTEITQAMFIRRALEVEMVRIMAPRMTDELIAKLELNLGCQQVAVDRADAMAFHTFDLAFHQLLLDELAFPRVTIAVDAARASLERARRLLMSPRRHAATLVEHTAIVARLKTRDSAAAATAMESHLDAVLSELTAIMSVNPAAFETA
jgi:DNA-binding GntR family transcriptional regulator